MKNIFFLLLTLLCTFLHGMDIFLQHMDMVLSPLIVGNVQLDGRLTRKILYQTLENTYRSGQYLALLLVCSSWQELCRNDKGIINHLLQIQEYNQSMLYELARPFTNYISGYKLELEVLKKTDFFGFDVRYESNDSSFLKYSIQKKFYFLFEKLLTHPYVIIRPIILETIINNTDMNFFKILKKYAFNFERYHFECEYTFDVFFDKSIPYSIPIVTYANKKQSVENGEESFLFLMKKKIAENVLLEKQNQDCLNKNKSIFPMFFGN